MSRKFSHLIPLNGILKCIAVYALVLMIAAKTNIYYYRKWRVVKLNETLIK